MNALEILTGSDWNAEPWYYDFLCRIEFNQDGTGTMKFGGGQILRLEVTFRYRISGDKRIKFECFDTESEFFSNASFWRTVRNAFCSVEFKIQEGPFVIDEPYVGKKQYQYLLKFSRSPFPIGTYVEGHIVEFYGWRKE